jgi:hypothetical protein
MTQWHYELRNCMKSSCDTRFKVTQVYLLAQTFGSTSHYIILHKDLST